MNNKNTILVTVDALRRDHLKQYGYERNTLPAVDRLVEDGQKLDSVHSNGSYTKVSVPSFLTSRLNGVDHIETGPSVASVLSDHGLNTVGIHSNTWLSQDFNTFHGFDHFTDFTNEEEIWSGENSDSVTSEVVQQLEEQFGSVVSRSELLTRFIKGIIPSKWRHSSTPYVNAENTTDKVIDWIDENQSEPFFIWVHYMDPHRPFGISSNYYVDEQYSTEYIHELMSKAGASPEDLTQKEENLIVDLYDSDIRYMSKHISRLFEYLDSNSIYDDTNIILTADHGEEFGEHGMYFHRNKPYSELINIPFFIKSDQEIPRGLYSLLDVSPTILDPYGLEIPESFEGQPLQESDTDVAMSIGYIGEQDYISIFDSEYMLIQRVDQPDDYEFYKINNGVEKCQNKQALETLKQYMPENGEIKFEGPEMIEPGDSTESRLEDLGYL